MQSCLGYKITTKTKINYKTQTKSKLNETGEKTAAKITTKICKNLNETDEMNLKLNRN